LSAALIWLIDAPTGPVGFDTNLHHRVLGVLTELLGDHRVQQGDAGHALVQSCSRRPSPAGVHQLHHVVLGCAVISDQQLRQHACPRDPIMCNQRGIDRRPGRRTLNPAQVSNAASAAASTPRRFLFAAS
jgi:hypothetical protein